MQDFESLNNAQLVTAYNELVAEARKQGIGDYREVTRFASAQVGINRCKGIVTALKANADESKRKPDKSEPKPKLVKPKQKAKTKTKTKAAAKPKEGKAYASKICEAFDVRSGSNREALLLKLEQHLKEPVPMRKLFVAVYGSADEGNRGKLLMVMKGLLVSISRDKLPFRIEKSKNEDKEVCFALHPGK